MPPLLMDMIKDTIAAQPDMAVVDIAAGDAQLLRLAERADADIVILSRQTPTERARYGPLLFGRPNMKVFEIVDEGRRCLLYELRPSRIAIDEISPQGLLDAIRAPRGKGR
jgi:DNA-binding NarL/FixJ family response regulator